MHARHNAAVRPNGAASVAAALLLVQGGIGFVAAAGMIVFRVVSTGRGVLDSSERFALLVPLALLLLSFGVANGHGWARWGTVAVETLLLALAMMVRVLVNSRLDLVTAMSTLGLPAVTLLLVVFARLSSCVLTEHPQATHRAALPLIGEQ